VILCWLQEQGYDVHAVYVDLGQPCEDRQAIIRKAENCGAKTARIVDVREELCREFAFPIMQFQAKYEGGSAALLRATARKRDRRSRWSLAV